jgi:hypothetical protein
VLAVEPLDAHVFRGNLDLGASPVVIEVPEGTGVALTIRREGYADTALTLDGARSREIVKLEPRARPRSPSQRRAPAALAAPKPSARPAAPKNPPKPLGDGEIVNPWK